MPSRTHDDIFMGMDSRTVEAHASAEWLTAGRSGDGLRAPRDCGPLTIHREGIEIFHMLSRGPRLEGYL